MTEAAAILGLFAFLGVGMAFAALMDAAADAVLAGRPLGAALAAPFRNAAAHLGRQNAETEAPDRLLAAFAPMLYLGLAATGLSVVPLAPGVVAADIPTGSSSGAPARR